MASRWPDILLAMTRGEKMARGRRNKRQKDTDHHRENPTDKTLRWPRLELQALVQAVEDSRQSTDRGVVDILFDYWV